MHQRPTDLVAADVTAGASLLDQRLAMRHHLGELAARVTSDILGPLTSVKNRLASHCGDRDACRTADVPAHRPGQPTRESVGSTQTGSFRDIEAVHRDLTSDEAGHPCGGLPVHSHAESGQLACRTRTLGVMTQGIAQEPAYPTLALPRLHVRHEVIARAWGSSAVHPDEAIVGLAGHRRAPAAHRVRAQEAVLLLRNFGWLPDRGAAQRLLDLHHAHGRPIRVSAIPAIVYAPRERRRPRGRDPPR